MTLALGSAYSSSRTTVAERPTHGHYQCGGDTHRERINPPFRAIVSKLPSRCG